MVLQRLQGSVDDGLRSSAKILEPNMFKEYGLEESEQVFFNTFLEKPLSEKLDHEPYQNPHTNRAHTRYINTSMKKVMKPGF